jgi:hypothetical protein
LGVSGYSATVCRDFSNFPTTIRRAPPVFGFGCERIARKFHDVKHARRRHSSAGK